MADSSASDADKVSVHGHQEWLSPLDTTDITIDTKQEACKARSTTTTTTDRGWRTEAEEYLYRFKCNSRSIAAFSELAAYGDSPRY